MFSIGECDCFIGISLGSTTNDKFAWNPKILPTTVPRQGKANFSSERPFLPGYWEEGKSFLHSSSITSLPFYTEIGESRIRRFSAEADLNENHSSWVMNAYVTLYKCANWIYNNQNLYAIFHFPNSFQEA